MEKCPLGFQTEPGPSHATVQHAFITIDSEEEIECRLEHGLHHFTIWLSAVHVYSIHSDGYVVRLQGISWEGDTAPFVQRTSNGRNTRYHFLLFVADTRRAERNAKKLVRTAPTKVHVKSAVSAGSITLMWHQWQPRLRCNHRCRHCHLLRSVLACLVIAQFHRTDQTLATSQHATLGEPTYLCLL